MRYLILILALLVAVPSFAAKKTVLASANKSPDVLIYKLHTANTASTNDTLADQDDVNIYGPYNLVPSNGDPMPTTVQVWADAATGTTPTMSLDYEIIPSFDLADTFGVWTAIDTIGSASNQSCTIAGVGKAIVFRLNNYDGTASEVPGDLWVGIKGAITTAVKEK